MSGSHHHYLAALEPVEPISELPLHDKSKEDVGSQGVQFYGGLAAATKYTLTGVPLVEHSSNIEYKNPARADFNRKLEACLKDEKIQRSEEAVRQVKLMMGQNDTQTFFNEPMPQSTVDIFIEQVYAHAELDAKNSGKASESAHAALDKEFHPRLAEEFAKAGYTSGEILHGIGYADAAQRHFNHHPDRPSLSELKKATRSLDADPFGVQMDLSVPVAEKEKEVKPQSPKLSYAERLQKAEEKLRKAGEQSYWFLPRGIARRTNPEYSKAINERDDVLASARNDDSATPVEKARAERILAVSSGPSIAASSSSSSDSRNDDRPDSGHREAPTSSSSPQEAHDRVGQLSGEAVERAVDHVVDLVLSGPSPEAQEKLDGQIGLEPF